MFHKKRGSQRHHETNRSIVSKPKKHVFDLNKHDNIDMGKHGTNLDGFL